MYGRRSSMISASIAAALAIVAAIGSAPQLSAFEVSAQAQVQTGWSGFGDDFNPQWYGDTKRVDWRPPSGSGGVIIQTGGIGGGLQPPVPTKPIRLVSSTRQQSYSSQSSVLGVIAEMGNNRTRREAGVFGSNVAQYAQILNLQDLELAMARTVSEQYSTLTDNSISASGRVSTSATLHSQLSGQGESMAFSRSLLSATYQVTERMPFTLSGSLAGAGALNIGLSIVDQTGKSILQVTPAITSVGRSWDFEFAGSLVPGSYEIKVDAQTSASSDSLLKSRGGAGEYKLSFSAIVPPAPGDLNGDSEVNGADLGVWRSNFGRTALGDLNADGITDGADFLVWQRHSRNSATAVVAEAATAVPEPDSLLLLTCGLSALALVGKR